MTAYLIMTWVSARKSLLFAMDNLEEAKMGQWGKDVGLSRVLAEYLDGADAVGVENVVNIRGEILADGDGRDGDSRGPLCDQVFDVEEAVVAGGFEVFSELRCGESSRRKGFGADGPDCGDPGEVGAGVPLVGEIEPLAGADFFFDGFAGFEGEEGGVADEDGGVGVAEHRDWVSRCGKEGGAGVKEFAEENLGVGEGTAGGGIGGDAAEACQGVWALDY